jgi:hypothetical protein
MTTDENTFKKSAKGQIEAQQTTPAQHIDPNDDDFDIDLFLERNSSNPLAFPGEIPGYRLKWASKGVTGDIARHKEVGYTVVRPEELSHYTYSDTSSQDEITVNEMVLMKVSERIRQKLMQHAYRTEPDRQVAGLRSEVLAKARQEALESGVDGFNAMSGRQKAARFE